MKETTLDEAIAEAKRFITIAEALQAAQSEAVGARQKRTGRWSTVAESGAMKRASMDLTRKLAEVRKPWSYD